MLLIHHTPKNNPEDLRGSGGIREEPQTVFVVVGQAHAKVKTVKNIKNRPLGENIADFGLAFVTPAGEDGFMFEPVPDDEEGVTIGNVPPPPSPLTVEVAAIDAVHVGRVLAFLTEHEGLFEGSETALAKELGGNKQAVLRAIRTLKDDGGVTVSGRPPRILLNGASPRTSSASNGYAHTSPDDFINPVGA